MSLDAHDSNDGDELDPDEPKTPLWMPILGLSLFLLGLVFALTGSEEAPPDAAGGDVAAEAPADEAAPTDEAAPAD